MPYLKLLARTQLAYGMVCKRNASIWFNLLLLFKKEKKCIGMSHLCAIQIIVPNICEFYLYYIIYVSFTLLTKECKN